MTRSTFTLTGCLTAALLAGCAALAPTAMANTTTPVASGNSGTNGASAAVGAGGVQHCTVDLATGTQACFGTFTEAVTAASGGQVTDAPASAAAGARSTELRKELKGLAGDARGAHTGAAADGVIQGTFFEDAQYGGSSLTVYGEKPCEKDGWVNFQYDLSDDWKNRITSVQPWANCALWLYPEPNLGGDRDGPFDENAPDVGSFMNDRTQSIGFS